jgi:hypothetical protein
MTADASNEVKKKNIFRKYYFSFLVLNNLNAIKNFNPIYYL